MNHPRRWIGPLTVLALLLPAAGTPAEAPPADTLRASIVKIHSTIRTPELFRPWTKASPQTATGSGVVIDGHRIITNAHVVRYASQVYVQPYQSADRLPARVSAISHAMDLAVLELEDPTFFKDHRPLPLADTLPQVKQQVNAYGYPTGGEELSITEGIVSRIEIAPYNLGALGLVIQVDAALNPGNSGGPAIIDGRIAGIVRSGIPSAENIGYLIPAEEVRTFLDDIADGTYHGKARLRLQLQTAENPALRARLGMDADTTGLIVTRVDDDDSPLQPWDVLTHIAGHDIHNDGQVRLTDNLRVSYHHHVDRAGRDGTLPVTIFRDGASQDLDIPTEHDPNLLVPPLAGRYPRYYIYGPLVFTQATTEIVNALPPRARIALLNSRNPMLLRIGDPRDQPDQELVIISSPLLPHRITKGYDNPMLAVVDQVNGQAVTSLRRLVEQLERSTDRFIVIQFADRGRENLVFERAELLAAMESMLTDNGIRHRASRDLRPLLQNLDTD